MTAKLDIVPKDKQYSEKCISAAEKLLERAKSGEIVSFVAICDCPGDTWQIVTAAHPDRIQLLGKMYLAMWSVASRMFDDNDT